MNLLNVQVQEMKSMSNAIRKLEGIEASLSLSLSLALALSILKSLPPPGKKEKKMKMRVVSFKFLQFSNIGVVSPWTSSFA